MQADYSVELGKEDPALELPWVSADGATRYYDLKRNPELVLQIPEALGSPELSAFLSRINAAGFPLETAKCDLWYSRELSADEEVFAANGKFVSYVDLVFTEDQGGPSEPGSMTNNAPSAKRLAFEQHETLAKSLCALLKRAPEMKAAIELVIRRCYYHPEGNSEDSSDGFCITAYVSGFGDDQSEARQRWNIAITLLQHALVQAVRCL
jgi:hypothetical protein